MCETQDRLGINLQVVESLPADAYMLVGKSDYVGRVQVFVATQNGRIAMATLLGGKLESLEWLTPQENA